jgi:hypothetical protein
VGGGPGFKEHEAIARGLTQLGGAGLGDETFSTVLAELKGNVEHHVSEEEGTLFEQARALINKDEAVALREQFERVKSQLQAQ